MLQRILVATDFSSAAHNAVARAARLAAEAGATLEVVHVARPRRRSLLAWLRREPEVAAGTEVARERLEDVVASARRHGADVRGHVVTGTPVTALAATARRLKANLVVVGARGVLRFRDQMLGTTAERLIEQELAGDVLVVRKPARAPYRTLLACVDLGPAAAQALRSALRLAPQATARVLHAYEPPFASLLRNAGLRVQAREHRAFARSRALEALEEFLRDAEVDADRLKVALRIGEPRQTIERAAPQLDPDLTAVGHHTSPLAQPFLGSVARHVLRLSVGDVLVSRHA
ncbi:universal stress protein [Nannocystis bainbridge]|uniref:Universal stress protein n=1 Tax=Nannocystis bainbridge TaxID=2995303 RepID=A0ABT5E656_9BACT|nr:universal stress protein [Nannocystis bainbridge]MDC0720928.1 universal stress protein [Nannocystis bainbridge]